MGVLKNNYHDTVKWSVTNVWFISNTFLALNLRFKLRIVALKSEVSTRSRYRAAMATECRFSSSLTMEKWCYSSFSTSPGRVKIEAPTQATARPSSSNENDSIHRLRHQYLKGCQYRCVCLQSHVILVLSLSWREGVLAFWESKQLSDWWNNRPNSPAFQKSSSLHCIIKEEDFWNVVWIVSRQLWTTVKSALIASSWNLSNEITCLF